MANQPSLTWKGSSPTHSESYILSQRFFSWIITCHENPVGISEMDSFAAGPAGLQSLCLHRCDTLSASPGMLQVRGPWVSVERGAGNPIREDASGFS